MSCDLARTILHAYLDGELDAARAAEYERHLEACRECTAALGAQESLSAALKHANLYEAAPLGLRQKIRAGLDAATVADPVTRRALWRWYAVAAAILLVAFVSWLALPSFQSTTPSTLTAAELIDAHVRSLQPGHLTDVASTDQHTVRPWFDGKLDFIPPVKDYVDEGFPLVGGRLDVLNGRSVAALVYGRRKHIINVFVWPTQRADTPIHPPGSGQGYQWLHWRHQGMEFCVISDASMPDLRELSQLLLQ